ncbi:hypothetical protein [Pedobacter frigiditerrae]|uniref:hypothetical protein n=1 Tax=Pedobacter frigiditerrae TaxID=2530452 RepID=UPI002930A762|nr:hypothetical protein [Pedobacter frigiditerrae]
MKALLKSILLTSGLLIAIINPLFAHDTEVSNTVIGNGIGMGSALAIAICWTRTKSVLTTIIAGFFGWLFVIYYLLTRDKAEQ